MKTISLLFLMFFLFQIQTAFSMNGEEEKISLSNIKLASNLEDQKDECCTHWGLKRWVYGIKEYVIDRCLCCTMCGFNPMDADRAYNFEVNGISTDCACVACSPWGAGFLHNNPITGILCFPLATVTHLMCLPCTCCSPTKDDWWTETTKHRQEETKRRKEEEIKRKKAEIDAQMKAKMKAYKNSDCSSLPYTDNYEVLNKESNDWWRRQNEYKETSNQIFYNNMNQQYYQNQQQYNHNPRNW